MYGPRLRPGISFVPTQKPQMRVGGDCENCDNNYRSTARQFDPFACAIVARERKTPRGMIVRRLRSPDQTIDPDVKETCSQSSGCSDIVPQSNSRRECRVPELPLEEEVYVEHPGIVGDRARSAVLRLVCQKGQYGLRVR